MGTVLRNCLQGTGRNLNGHKLLEFGNPDALGAKIRGKVTRSHGSDMHANTTFFLGKTSAVDFRAAHWARTGNRALSGHNEIG